MERKRLKLLYDKEGDYLKVFFDEKEGYFRETENDQVMERVDAEGNLIGFSILNISVIKNQPLSIVKSLMLVFCKFSSIHFCRKPFIAFYLLLFNALKTIKNLT